MADMLQKYLTSGLLEIGDDDARYAKLRDVAADLQKLFASQPRTGLYHALMVYSGNADSEDQCSYSFFSMWMIAAVQTDWPP